MADISIKKGDRLPSVERILDGPSGPQDLSAASEVLFRWGPIAGGMSGGGTCVIVDATAAHVRYDWGINDTATPGTFRAEFVATLAGKEITFPNDGYLTVVILDDVS